jgi:hypothetical protein
LPLFIIQIGLRPGISLYKSCLFISRLDSHGFGHGQAGADYHLRMLCSNMSLQIVLPGETSFSAAKSVPTFSMMTVETATVVLGLMSDEVFLQ